MDEPLDIIIVGFDGDSRRSAEARLIDTFGLDRDQARRLLRQLPVLVKRRAGPETARRYIEVLHAIGAHVQTRLSVSAPPEGDGPISVLPLPPASAVARLRASVRVERETARAIRRFREAEGLSDGPPINLLNPAIPKAPKLPRDLAKLPNAALPIRTDPPPAIESLAPQGVFSAPAPLAAQRPPPHSLAAGASSSSIPTTAHSYIDSVRPEGVGLVRHRSDSQPRRPSGPPLRKSHGLVRKRWSQLAVIGLLLAVVLLALWTTGLLPSEERSRLAAWRAAGIEPGEYATAGLWLALADNRLEGVSRGEGRSLLEKLTRAGAKNAYVVQIERSSRGRVARGLLVELPRDSEARRTVFWHAAGRTKARSMLHLDTGQRFYVLRF